MTCRLFTRLSEEDVEEIKEQYPNATIDLINSIDKTYLVISDDVVCCTYLYLRFGSGSEPFFDWRT